MTNNHSPVSRQEFAAGQRIALTLEYDGALFNGWQLQRGSAVTSVQGTLETALGRVADGAVRLACAGRTDSGVHATNQVVHFEAPVARSPRAWLMGGNANLPESVVIRAAQAMPGEFHARFSALSRRYRYLIANTPVRPALLPSQLTWVRRALDVASMHREAQSLLGERDFTSFRAASCQSTTPMRRVDFLRVFRHGDLVVIDIQANAFLHHMVRNIAGTLIAVGRGDLGEGSVERLLAMRDRTRAADTAPPNGLYLVGVEYPERFGLARLAPGPLLLAGVPD